MLHKLLFHSNIVNCFNPEQRQIYSKNDLESIYLIEIYLMYRHPFKMKFSFLGGEIMFMILFPNVKAIHIVVYLDYDEVEKPPFYMQCKIC